MWVTFLTGFGIGLASSFHCVGMCGGIVGAFSFNVHPRFGDGALKKLPLIVAFNLGRIGSYVLAGLLIGSISQLSVESFRSPLAFSLLQQFAAVILIAIGFYIAGWFPQFTQIERVGSVIWSRLEPIGRRFVPIDHSAKALMFGTIWGWLPCGMVYSMLLMALTSGDVGRGGIFMLAFGLGTLPAMIGAGMFAGLMRDLAKVKVFKKLVGILLIAVAVITLVQFQRHAGADDVDHSAHHNHTSHTQPHLH